jgi:hypothetical protein
VNGCDKWGKDRWQTEYCCIEDTNSPHAVGTVRRFISDLAFMKNNYWFTWTVNDGYGNDTGDVLCFGNGVSTLVKKPSYYVLKKLFSSIPVGSKVRRITSTDKDLITSNAGKMDMVAFASDTNMVAVIVNPTSGAKTTMINGLIGSKALVYQMATTKNNTDISLISTNDIMNGSIETINIPVNSVTIIVTTGIKTSAVDLKSKMNRPTFYPTVCDTHITIQTIENKTDEYELSLANFNGQRILSRNIHFINSYSLDVSDIKNGMYFLTLQQSNSEPYCQKILVTK